MTRQRDAGTLTVTPAGPGVYRVSDGKRQWTVAVAGPPSNRWVWIDGLTAQIEPGGPVTSGRGRSRSSHQDLTAPMPATVVRVLTQPGSRVTRGDTLLMLEAMKMELPIRAPRDAVVKAVLCKAGDLVQTQTVLVDLE